MIKGTSMGASWAPAYASIGGIGTYTYTWGLWVEEEVFTSPMYLGHVHTWLRYIHWKKGKKKLRFGKVYKNQN